MFKSYAIIILSFVLVGCEVPRPTNGVDQCLRQELFSKCLAELPKGPEAAVYNDWAEVVTSCQNAAYSHSLRKYEYVKPECRSS